MSVDEKEELAEIAQISADFAQEGEKFEVVEPPLEDTIPDLPENQAAREFLKKAPKVGLHMPLGKEVKVMQCWRCKAYGHRTGDRECPMNNTGNVKLDSQRQTREDPMSLFVQTREVQREEKYERVQQLMLLMEEIRKEERERKARKAERKKSKQSKRNRDDNSGDERRKEKKRSKKSKQ